MRKITEQATHAFWDGWHFKKSNTEVHLYDGSVSLRLHNHIIALKDGDELTINSCDWRTNTTKERLNGILQLIGYAIRQHKGQWEIVDLKSREVSEFKDGMVFQLSEVK